MSVDSRISRARELYLAFAAGERATVEGLLSEDFEFSSPVDPSLDRAGYFERCRPGAGQEQRFRRARNTEVLTFRGERICRAEVYFGWDLD